MRLTNRRSSEATDNDHSIPSSLLNQPVAAKQIMDMTKDYQAQASESRLAGSSSKSTTGRPRNANLSKVSVNAKSIQIERKIAKMEDKIIVKAAFYKRVITPDGNEKKMEVVSRMIYQ